MAVSVTKETEKYLWNTCSLTWTELPKIWKEAEKAFIDTAVDETITYQEKATQPTKFLRSFSSEFSIGESNSRRVEFKRNFIEPLNFAEVYWDNIAFILRILEDIKIADKKKAVISKPLEDNFSIIDMSKNRPVSVNAESISIVDNFSRQATFFIACFEDVVLSEKHSDNVHFKPSFAEVFGLSDDEEHTAKFRPIFAEALGLQETYLDNISFNLDVAENIGVQDLLSNRPTKPFAEKFSIVDKEHNAILVCSLENISVEELVKTFRPIIRKFFETFSFQETPKKLYSASHEESFGIRDAVIKASEGVISDIIITDSGMSFEEFMNAADAPPLYSKFIDFKVGEYEYEKAIVKLKLSTTARESLPSILGCVMHVDIPDTDDRGSVTITDTTQPTKVYFNRHYYNPPEVNVNLKNGNTAMGAITPNIVSTEGIDDEGRYFEVELLDSSNNRTTGTISWVSKGY